MKKGFVALVLFFSTIGNTLSAQPSLHNIYKLDTIVYLPHNCEAFEQKMLAMNTSNNYLYIAKLNHEKKRSVIQLTQISLINFNIKNTAFILNSKLSKKINRSRISALYTDGHFIFFSIMALRENYIVRCNLADMSVSSVIKTTTKMDMIQKCIKNKFWYSYCYNTSNPSMQQSKTYLGIGDNITGAVDTNLNLLFSGIEFSHFRPNHWIDAFAAKILFAQTLTYNITIFDTTLNISDSISRDIENWKQMDTAKLYEIASGIPIFQSKKLIESLEPFHNGTISRVDGAWFINDTSILVRYYMPMKTDDFLKYKYYYDIWINRENRWNIKHKDLTDDDTNLTTTAEDIISKNDIPVMGWINPFCISNNSIAVVKIVSDVLPYGKTSAQIKEENQAYFKTKDPLLAVYIYKAND